MKPCAHHPFWVIMNFPGWHTGNVIRTDYIIITHINFRVKYNLQNSCIFDAEYKTARFALILV